VIDTHCHLTFPEFAAADSPVGGVPGVLKQAADAGVSGVITISTTHGDALKALAIAKQHDRVWSSAGVHPLYADEGPHDWDILAQCIKDPKCVAFGELGLDRFHHEPAMDVQLAVLNQQLDFIQRMERDGYAKPIILHCREAFADLIPHLKSRGVDGRRCVFHCFTAGPDEMQMVLNFGALVSFTGVVTYKSAKTLRQAIKLCPIDRIMVETDAPYLPPEPHRAQRPCVPAYTALTARSLADTLGVGFDELHAQINATTSRFFGIPAY
jgi:TatD DNase family protein